MSMKLKQLLIGAVLAVSAMSLLAEATARPMGGGRSIGRQSQNVNRMPPAAAPQQAPRQAAPAAAPAPAPAMPPKPASPWKGILGGALLGLGLGALFSHLCFGSAMSGILGTVIMLALLAGVVVLLFRLFGRKSAPAMAPAGAPAGYSGNNNYGGGYAAQPASTGGPPEIG